MLKMHNKMFHVYWYLGTAIGMNLTNLNLKSGVVLKSFMPTIFSGKYSIYSFYICNHLHVSIINILLSPKYMSILKVQKGAHNMLNFSDEVKP
jgi:hypothetical protein